MPGIQQSACYYSVFDKCYLRNDEDGTKPKPVDRCTPPAKPFAPKFLPVTADAAKLAA